MPEFESSDLSGTDSGKIEREGLPAGYRMRADAHYVDSLSSGAPRADRARDLARPATTDDASTRQGAADRRLFDHLAEDVAAIESAAAMLTAERSSLVRRVGLDLIKAQAARTSWLLRASALAGGADADTGQRHRPLGAILAEIRDRAAVECRLMGVGLEVEVSDEAAMIERPDALLSAGLTGAVMAQLGLVSGVERSEIRLRATMVPGKPGSAALSIDVSQNAVPLPAGAHARFFDAGWVARPGGWIAALGAATARIAAERLGGTATIVTAERRGSTIHWSLP